MGGGTGFCTQGVVQHVPASNVTLMDQSPDQLNKARGKADLQGVTIVEVCVRMDHVGAFAPCVRTGMWGSQRLVMESVTGAERPVRHDSL